MSSITEIAKKFFDACDTGKGWAQCKEFCTPDATFFAQSEPLVDIKTLQAYTDWMTLIMQVMPDGRYELISFATDEERKNVVGVATFYGTTTGTVEGFPPPTNKKMEADYAYCIQFDDSNKIMGMRKVWNSGWSSKEVDWV